MFFSPLDAFTTIPVLHIYVIGLDFTVFSTIIPLILVKVLFLFLFFILRRDYYIIPSFLQYFIEQIILFNVTLIKEQAGLKVIL